MNYAGPIVGVKYDKGVMIAADNLVSYGSLARNQNVVRCVKVNERTIMAPSGNFADFQSIQRSVAQKSIEDMYYDREISLKPLALYSWLTRILYNRRLRFDILLVEIAVGGFDADDGPFLGLVDYRGKAYQDDFICTGIAQNLALPMFRAKKRKIGGKRKLKVNEAVDLINQAMEVLYYRHCRATSQFYVAIATSAGAAVEGPFRVDENWELATLVKGY